MQTQGMYVMIITLVKILQSKKNCIYSLPQLYVPKTLVLTLCIQKARNGPRGRGCDLKYLVIYVASIVCVCVCFFFQFHRECIDEWLRSNHITCPIDGQPVYDPTHQQQHTAGAGRLLPLRTQQRRRSTARNLSRQLAPLSQAAQRSRLENGGASGVSNLGGVVDQAEFSISGQSIIGGGTATSSRTSAKRKKASGLR